jgi:hypothetical protein
MKNILLNILLFPTWMLVNIMNRFVSAIHPWHKKYFSMAVWRTGSTKTNYNFAILFWFTGIICVWGWTKITIEFIGV